eukprot:998509_1
MTVLTTVRKLGSMAAVTTTGFTGQIILRVLVALVVIPALFWLKVRIPPRLRSLSLTQIIEQRSSLQFIDPVDFVSEDESIVDLDNSNLETLSKPLLNDSGVIHWVRKA